ncbi:MAG: hypothetical protein P8076_10080 [Gammaproteobacteria bacterium]
MRPNLPAAVVSAALLIAATQSAAAGRLMLTTGIDYSTGKYGGSQSTDITFIPVVAKYESRRWVYKLTVPYIRITGPGNVIPDVGQVTGGTAPRRTDSGLGDIVASATYSVYSSRETQTLVDLTGKVKFATADEKKGLGTGKNDYAFQADVYKLMGELTPFATLGYKVLGNPSGYRLNNVWYGSLGAAYRFSRVTSGGLILDLRERSSAAGSPHRELTAFVSRKLTPDWKLQGYVVKGFADGSPDWGVGAMISCAYR